MARNLLTLVDPKTCGEGPPTGPLARGRRHRTIATSLAAALLVAACGGDNNGDDAGNDRPETTTTVATASAAEGSGVVPDIVGLRLPEARALLDGGGFSYQVVTETRPVPASDENWEVCRVSPHAGVTVPLHARIEVLVARPGECGGLFADDE